MNRMFLQFAGSGTKATANLKAYIRVLTNTVLFLLFAQEVPPQYSSSLGALIKQLLAKSPDDRPS